MTTPTIEVLMGIDDLAGQWAVSGPGLDDFSTFEKRDDALAHAAQLAGQFGQAVMFHVDSEH